MSTGAALVTRMTGLPSLDIATAKSSWLTSPLGRAKPTRSKMTGEARRARSCSSSPGSLEMTGISASSGWPGCDMTRISPRPNAQAAWLAASRASASALRAAGLKKACFKDIPCGTPPRL